MQKVCAARAHEQIRRPRILGSAHFDPIAGCSCLLDMARGNFKVGDEVAVTATVRGRVTPDPIKRDDPLLRLLPAFGCVDSASKAGLAAYGIDRPDHAHRRRQGDRQPQGDHQSPAMVTVDAEHVRLVERHMTALRRKIALLTKPTAADPTQKPL